MGSCWEGCCMLHQFQYPSWYLASLPVYIGLYHSTPNQLSFWRLFFIFSPFKVGLHFQVYLKDPFFLWSYSWSSTWPSVILSYSLVHNQGLGFEGQCPPPPFFFSYSNVLPHALAHTIPPPSLSGIPILSFICSPLGVSAPLCPCNMTSGQHQQRSLLCFPRLQKTLWPPPPAAVSDHVTQSWAANLHPALLLRDWIN